MDVSSQARILAHSQMIFVLHAFEEEMIIVSDKNIKRGAQQRNLRTILMLDPKKSDYCNEDIKYKYNCLKSCKHGGGKISGRNHFEMSKIV